MKKVTGIAAAAMVAAMTLSGAPSATAAPADAETPKRTATLLDDLHCKRVKPVLNDSTLKGSGDIAVTCRVKRSWGKQAFYVRRFDSKNPDITPWTNGLNSHTTGWGQSEAGCFVKKGRQIFVPLGVRGAGASTWCAYTERRVGGKLYQGQ